MKNGKYYLNKLNNLSKTSDIIITFIVRIIKAITPSS